jgi:NTE family protein
MDRETDSAPDVSQGTERARVEEKKVLLLQGGGALGAYQAGVYEELAGHGIAPEWVAGISIGAINAAIIAGNAPEKRVEKLRAFWNLVSGSLQGEPLVPGDLARTMFNEYNAGVALAFGINGFFRPRVPPPFVYLPGSPQALSYYDTAPLRATLLSLVDFDRINRGEARLSVGAVNIRNGNFVYFDSARQIIGPEHIMASGALPPGFPPVEIDGEYYWDGGLVSNTPLQYVTEEDDRLRDLLLFQIDLFSARGPLPRNLFDVADREKDIRFSSRTRLNTDEAKQMQEKRAAFHRLLQKLPEEMKGDPDVQLLTNRHCVNAMSIVHLIYRRKHYETQSKDYEFSRNSVEEHWHSGRLDMRRTLRHPKWKDRMRPESGVAVFDLADAPG